MRERTLTVSLLARLIYAVEIGNHQRMAAAWPAKGPKLPDPPGPVELPGDPPRPKRGADITRDDLRAFRERHKTRGVA